MLGLSYSRRCCWRMMSNKTVTLSGTSQFISTISHLQPKARLSSFFRPRRSQRMRYLLKRGTGQLARDAIAMALVYSAATHPDVHAGLAYYRSKGRPHGWDGLGRINPLNTMCA